MTRVFLLGLLLIVAAGPTVSVARQTQDAPETDRQATQALENLGPGRGGIPFSGRSVEILGIIRGAAADEAGLKSGESKGIEAGGLGFSGEVKEIEQAMKDLGAQVTQQEIRVNLPGDILFDFDKWDIRPDAEASLQKLAAIIRATKSKQVVIAGHTDSKGSEAYNLKLSLKRAHSVKDWLTQNAGLESKFMDVHGFGEAQLVAPNDTAAGRQQNRRVEVVIKKK